MNVAAEVNAIVEREQATTSSEWMQLRIHRAIAALPGMDARDPYTCRWKEYELEVQRQFDYEVEVLAALRPLDIAAAPEVAALIPFDGGKVIVRRYWACPGEDLEPVANVPGAFDPVARDRFRRDMAALVSTGRVHTYARGLAYFHVSSNTRTIVLDRWASVETGDEERCQAFLKSIDRQLASRD